MLEETEQIVPLADAAKLLPWKPHIGTLHRWRLRGIRGVKLETIRIGGRTFTSKAALRRFIAGTTASTGVDGPGGAPEGSVPMIAELEGLER